MGDRTTPGAAIDTLVILGGGGDLTTRFLLPAVAELIASGLVPATLEVVAVDRDDLDDSAYRSQAARELARHARAVPEHARDELCRRLHYRRGSATDTDQLRAATAWLDGRAAAVYLALPNTVFGAAIDALAEGGLAAGSRLVIEKPFGVDRADARRLNDVIGRTFGEQDVFRIDHVLAEPVVLDVLGLRFANRMIEPAWNTTHIESVDIVWDETIALEGRASYYDHAGALRDMIQNHLLQMLAVVAMEPPASMDERELRDRKADVLRAVRAPAPNEMRAATRRGRYGAGRTPAGTDRPAYVDEPGVDPGRGTETFAEVTLSVANARWAGVPFRLRTGKALAEDRREIVVRFRPPDHPVFGPAAASEQVRFTLMPDAIALEVNLNGSGDLHTLHPYALSAEVGDQPLAPYSRLLLEVLEGDPVLGVRGDEAEECWRIVEPILKAWETGETELEEYPAGSAGPAVSQPR